MSTSCGPGSRRSKLNGSRFDVDPGVAYPRVASVFFFLCSDACIGFCSFYTFAETNFLTRLVITEAARPLSDSSLSNFDCSYINQLNTSKMGSGIDAASKRDTVPRLQPGTERLIDGQDPERSFRIPATVWARDMAQIPISVGDANHYPLFKYGFGLSRRSLVNGNSQFILLCFFLWQVEYFNFYASVAASGGARKFRRPASGISHTPDSAERKMASIAAMLRTASSKGIGCSTF